MLFYAKVQLINNVKCKKSSILEMKRTLNFQENFKILSTVSVQTQWHEDIVETYNTVRKYVKQEGKFVQK